MALLADLNTLVDGHMILKVDLKTLSGWYMTFII